MGDLKFFGFSWLKIKIGWVTDSLRSCEYSKKDKLFDHKIHYITMILWVGCYDVLKFIFVNSPTEN